MSVHALAAVTALVILSAGGCSAGCTSGKSGQDAGNENRPAGDRAIAEQASQPKQERSVNFGQLRLATLDYLDHHPLAVPRGRDWLLGELADKSQDANMVGQQLAAVRGWTVDLPALKMYRSTTIGLGTGPAEIFDCKVLFSSVEPAPLVNEVRVTVGRVSPLGRR